MYEFFIILDIGPLSDIWFTNIFSHPVGFSFFWLLLFCTETFTLIYLFNFVFVASTFDVISKKIKPKLVWRSFSSRSFMVSDFTFKCLIHFELIFMTDVRWIPVLFFCVYCPIFPAPFTGETIFYLLSILALLSKIGLPWWLNW